MIRWLITQNFLSSSDLHLRKFCFFFCWSVVGAEERQDEWCVQMMNWCKGSYNVKSENITGNRIQFRRERSFSPSLQSSNYLKCSKWSTRRTIAPRQAQQHTKNMSFWLFPGHLMISCFSSVHGGILFVIFSMPLCNTKQFLDKM